ncbi:MAG: AraC family transcriptional regulator [Desulfobulbus sp.]|nr:AraC family transcriptional regulator [Desulfobulbus sp.]
MRTPQDSECLFTQYRLHLAQAEWRTFAYTDIDLAGLSVGMMMKNDQVIHGQLPSAPPAAAGNCLEFSTADLPAKDCLPYWCDVWGRYILGVEVDAPLTGEPFFFNAKVTRFPGLMMLHTRPAGHAMKHTRSAGHTMKRTRSLLNDGNGDILLSLNSRPWKGLQLGREVDLMPGDATFISCADVGTAQSVKCGAEIMMMRIPQEWIKRAVPDIEDRVARRIDRNNPALCLLKNYAVTWEQNILTATPALQETFVSHVHDLLVLIAGASGDAAHMAARRGGRAALLALIRREIEKGAAEIDFCLPMLASRLGMSPRKVQMLLEETGSSFVKEVTERRLQRAQQLLQSVRYRHLSIIEIAYECGFGSAAHFHRLFRRYCDTTPADWRHQQTTADGG